MSETKKLQRIADQKFGQGMIEIVFIPFQGFMANFSEKMDPSAGSIFLGDSWQAKEKLEAGNF